MELKNNGQFFSWNKMKLLIITNIIYFLWKLEYLVYFIIKNRRHKAKVLSTALSEILLFKRPNSSNKYSSINKIKIHLLYMKINKIKWANLPKISPHSALNISESEKINERSISNSFFFIYRFKININILLVKWD